MYACVNAFYVATKSPSRVHANDGLKGIDFTVSTMFVCVFRSTRSKSRVIQYGTTIIGLVNVRYLKKKGIGNVRK